MRRGARVDLRLEAVVILVSDVDRAKAFYEGLGWRLDADTAAPGSAQGLYLIVTDIEAARDALVATGVEVSDVFHPETPGAQFQLGDTTGRARGPAPGRQSYGSFATFSDPDGNGWLLQEVTTRLPGHVDTTETAFASIADLASALRRAEAAHSEHEKRTGQADANWPQRYAAYMAAEQAREELPT